jgi:hypothetical protein
LNESLLILLIAFLFPVVLFAQNNFEELLEELDQSVANYAIYSDTKEGEINQLKELLSYSSSASQRYDVYEKLYADINPTSPIQRWFTLERVFKLLKNLMIFIRSITPD